MESFTLYYQELSEDSLLIKVYSDKAQKSMIKELTENSIKVKSLEEYFK